MSDPDSTHQTVAIVLLVLMLVTFHFGYSLATVVLQGLLVIVAADGYRKQHWQSSGGDAE